MTETDAFLTALKEDLQQQLGYTYTIEWDWALAKTNKGLKNMTNLLKITRPDQGNAPFTLLCLKQNNLYLTHNYGPDPTIIKQWEISKPTWTPQLVATAIKNFYEPTQPNN